jgi:hypothetical protein
MVTVKFPQHIPLQPEFVRYILAELQVSTQRRKGQPLCLKHYSVTAYPHCCEAYCAHFSRFGEQFYFTQLAGYELINGKAELWGYAYNLKLENNGETHHLINRRGLRLTTFILCWQDFVLTHIRGHESDRVLHPPIPDYPTISPEYDLESAYDELPI